MSSRLERLRERFRADPAAKQVFETLEEHHFLAGEWDELVGIYDERLAALPLGEDNKTRAAVLMRKAQILEDRRGDVDAAVACYGEAIRADSDQHPALRRLREIHTSREQWDLALQIAEMESGLTIPVVERAALLAGIGSI